MRSGNKIVFEKSIMKRNKNILIGFSIFLFSSLLINNTTLAQYRDIAFNHISTNDGLSYYTVFSIAQDHNGFMWIGTIDGLNRFDGENIKVYRPDPNDAFSLGNSYIYALLTTSDSSLWVGTNRGLFYYDYFHDNFHPILPKDENGNPVVISVRSLIQDDNFLWIGATNGFYKYDLEHRKFLELQNEKKLFRIPVEFVYSMFKTDDDKLWLGTANGLYVFQDGKLEQHFLPGFENRSMVIRDVLLDEQENFWLGTDDEDIGLLIYNLKTGKINELSVSNGSLPNNKIRSMFRFSNGDFWVGTRNGLSVINEQTLETGLIQHDKYDPLSISQNSIRSIFESKEGIIWVGTYSGGLNYFNPNSKLIKHFTDEMKGDNTLSYNIVTSIFQDSKNDLWVGTDNEGVNIYNFETNTFSYINNSDDENSLVHYNIKDIIEDKYGKIYIATINGLSIYQPDTKRFFNLKNQPTSRGYLNSNTVYDLTEDRDGNIWIGTSASNVGLMKYDINKDSIIHFFPKNRKFPGLGDLTVNAQFHDKKRNFLWAGGDNGLIGFDITAKAFLESEKFRSTAQELSQVIVNDLLIDNNDFLWIATLGNGLYILDLDTYQLRKLKDEDGIDGASYFSMVCDDDGNIWISESAKIIKLYPIRSLNEKVKKNESFAIQEGFPPQQYYAKSAYKDKDGILYFGGDNGFISFDPEKVKNTSVYPKVTFTNIFTNGEQYLILSDKADEYMNIAALKTLKLKYQQSNFSVHFIAPNFLNQKNIWYRFLLSGQNQKWQDLGKSNSINFTELKAGNYELRIKASSDPNNFAAGYTALTIIVDPPFWRAPLAIVIYIAIVSGLLYAFFIIARQWEGLSQKLKYESLEREKEHEFHQQRIKFFTDISHELRTPLTLILAPLEKLATSNIGNARIQNQLLLMFRNGERMLHLINQLLDLRKLETGHMQIKAAKGNFAHFVQEVSFSFRELAQSRHIELKVDFFKDSINLWFDRDKFEIILFNLLSNAIKYTPDHGKINIIVYDEEDENAENKYSHISLKITNTGSGIPQNKLNQIFERFYSINSGTGYNKHSSGVGLEIAKKIIDLHHAKISVESEYDEKGINGFASFILTIPKGKKHFKKSELIKNFKSSEDISSYQKPVQIEELTNKKTKSTIEKVNHDQTILVVEDNAEVRKLVSDIFISSYNIVEAKNGDEGLERAKKDLPDLIISDIMMPGIDGIELCRRIKTDINTSHIPVILLTARTAVTFKYEGLETGADDYITKPFSVGDLEHRAVNLIKQRLRLKEHYGNSASLIPREITLNSVDEKLLKRTIDYITEHITATNLTIEKISEEVGMSRVHFYRKIKALTGLSAVEFLRKIKMERAAQLLKTNKFNVSEVSNLVGISDVDYFRKCFKKHFGNTPKEYQDQKINRH